MRRKAARIVLEEVRSLSDSPQPAAELADWRPLTLRTKPRPQARFAQLSTALRVDRESHLQLSDLLLDLTMAHNLQALVRVPLACHQAQQFWTADGLLPLALLAAEDARGDARGSSRARRDQRGEPPIPQPPAAGAGDPWSTLSLRHTHAPVPNTTTPSRSNLAPHVPHCRSRSSQRRSPPTAASSRAGAARARGTSPLWGPTPRAGGTRRSPR